MLPFSLQFIVNHIIGLFVYLQRPQVDIGKAYKLIKSIYIEFQNFRNNTHFFDNIYEDYKKKMLLNWYFDDTIEKRTGL